MNRKLLTVALCSLVCAGAWIPKLAQADEPASADVLTPPAEVLDTGDHVAIIVRNAMADVDGVEWKWGKMRVPIDHGPGATWARSVEDATIKRIAVVGGATPQVMVMFRHGDKTAQKLTTAAEIEAVEGGFKVMIPRKETVREAERLAKEAAAAAAEAQAKQDADIAVEGAPKIIAPAEAKPAAEAEGAIDEAEADAIAAVDEASDPSEPIDPIDPPVITPDDAPIDAEALEGVATASTSSSNAAWMGIMTSLLILGACGAGLVWMRRRNAVGLPGTKFEVLGNQTLGGKSRLVLLGLGERRMLLAVGEGGTTLVDKWSMGDPMRAGAERVEATSAPRVNRSAESPLAALEFDGMRGEAAAASEPSWIDELRGGAIATEAANDEGDSPDAESSAVSGLLELRRKYGRSERTSAPEDNRWVAALAAQLRAGDA